MPAPKRYHPAANVQRVASLILRTGLTPPGSQLTLIERIPGKSGTHDYWRCQCTCGEIATVRSSNLVGGKTKSCGCARRIKQAVTKQMTSQRWSIPTHEALARLVRLWRVDATMATELALQYLGNLASSAETTPQWLEHIPKAVLSTSRDR